MKLVTTTANALIIRTLPVQNPATDSKVRFLAGQAAEVLGVSLDKKWSFIDGPAGDGWVSTAYLSPLPQNTPTAPVVQKWPRVPTGRTEIEALFGPPCKPICERGRIDLPKALPLSWDMDTKVTRVACHELLEPVFESVFNTIHARGLWNLLEDYGGVHQCREVRGTSSKVSTHSWGIGCDLNARQNPLGARPRMPGQIVAIFADHGFTWGGTFSRPDGMHFQYARGY